MNRIVLLILLCGLTMISGCAAKDDVMIAQSEMSDSSSLENDYSSETTSTDSQMIYVYVCGHVKHPGVYALGVESRICDALELAGGVTESGNPQALEQAQHVKDGQTIYVPGWEEMQSSNEVDDGLININKADKELLMTLPGIGETKAELIIQYRLEHGDFESIEDLMNIPGIKEGVYNKIKDSIKVS